MTIERRVTFLGIPVRTRKANPSSQEVISKRGPGRDYLKVVVETEYELLVMRGHYEKRERRDGQIPLVDVTQTLLTRGEINGVDIKGSFKKGTRVSYRCNETEGSHILK